MSTKTLTIGELMVRVTSSDMGAHVVDTAVASEFDVEIEYKYRPRIPPSRLCGAFEDADPGEPAECNIYSVKASAAVHFEGDYTEVIYKRGAEMIGLFRGREIDELAERIIDAIENDE